jgi:hypothetical protein
MSVSPVDPALLSRDTASRYAAWLREVSADPSFDPYYSEEILRFEPRDGDVLVVPQGVSVAPASCGVAVAAAGALSTVCGVTPADASAILAAVDGRRTSGEIRAAARVSAAAWNAFRDGLFGKVLFAPAALAELEARVSFTEIVRFPGSPYEVVRAYWENSADVAERLRSLDAEVKTARDLGASLRELNVLCLVGAAKESFYRPASPVATKGELEPGALWLTPSVTEETSSGVRFVSGPRVNASPIGGERYQRALAQSVGDEGALESARALTDDGLAWGRVVIAKAASDDAPAPWFCPPRPFGDAHFASVQRALAGALAAKTEAEVVRHAAAVHYRLVRLHPFVSGNQSVAMALVNRVLRPRFGTGIPHLVLDHLALRFTLPAYAALFARAVSAWLSPEPSPVRRALELAAKRRQVFGFLEKIGAAGDREVEAIVAEDREAARLALLG